MVMYKKQKSHKKKLIIISVVCLSLLIAGAAFLAFRSSDKTSDKTNTEPEINFSPPTSEELDAGDRQKDESAKNTNAGSPQTPNSDGSKKKVTVLITDAGVYDASIEVRSFVPDYFQDGVCTISFTKGDLKLQKEAPAFTDSSTTICTNPQINKSEFSETGECPTVY